MNGPMRPIFKALVGLPVVVLVLASCGTSSSGGPVGLGAVGGVSFAPTTGYFNGPSGTQLTLVLADDAPAACGGGVQHGSNALQIFLNVNHVGGTFAAGSTIPIASPPAGDALLVGEATFHTYDGTCGVTNSPPLHGTVTLTEVSASKVSGNLSLGRDATATLTGNFSVPTCATFQNPIACVR
jgi:hypothetical protein